MLSNITSETVQFTNRNPYASSIMPQGSMSTVLDFHAGGHPESCIPAPAARTVTTTGLTPYAPATSIPRYYGSATSQNQHQQQQQPHYAQPSQHASSPIDFSMAHPPRSSSISQMPSPAVVAPSSNAVPAPTPVYAPSVPTTHPLFVDVFAGATTTTDDDTILLRNGYILPPAPTPPPAAPAPILAPTPQVPVGCRTVSPPQHEAPVAPQPTALPVPVTVAELEDSICRSQVSIRVGAASSATPSEKPQRPTNATRDAPVLAAEVTPARATRRQSKSASDGAQTPSQSNAKTPSGKRSQNHTSEPSTPQHAALYTVEVTGHRNRSQQVASQSRYAEGTYVVFEGDRGLDLGIVQRVSQEPRVTESEKKKRSPHNDGDAGDDIPMIVRLATKEEIHTWTEELPALAAEAVQECAQLIPSMHLRMRVVDASYQFDRQKLTLFYESSEQRVDFRKLLMELFNRYRCRIWLEKV